MSKIELIGNVTVSTLEGQWGYYKEVYFEDENSKEELRDILVDYEGKKMKITIEEL